MSVEQVGYCCYGYRIKEEDLEKCISPSALKECGVSEWVYDNNLNEFIVDEDASYSDNSNWYVGAMLKDGECGIPADMLGIAIGTLQGLKDRPDFDATLFRKLAENENVKIFGFTHWY